MYKVQKKNGSLEDFDRSKIISGILGAGGSQEEAEKIAAQIESWLPTATQNNVVQSSDIRTKGLEIMKTLNPTMAASFESYKKQG